MRSLHTGLATVALGALLGGSVAAQTPAPRPTVPGAPQPAPVPGQVFPLSKTPLPPAYDSSGRRDPFVSLIAPKKDTSPAAVAAAALAAAAAGGVAPAPHPLGTGLASVAVKDAAVKGILRSGTTLMAILESPDGRSFIAKSKDRLLDGAVKSIEPGAVVFAVNVADAQGVWRSQDVRRLLRPVVGGGQ